MPFRDGPDKGTPNCVQISGPWRSGKGARAKLRCLNGSGQTEKGETDEEQSLEHAHHFL
jgi:hypothetical protein